MQTLARRRREYCDMVPEYYAIPNQERSEDELGALRQVLIINTNHARVRAVLAVGGLQCGGTAW